MPRVFNLDWIEGQSVVPLLQAVERVIGPRRTRLLSVAFCERVAHLLPHDSFHGWLALARRYADRQARQAELAVAHAAIERAYDRGCQRWKTLRDRATTSALRALRWATHPTQRYYAHYAANDAAEAAGFLANADTTDPDAYLERRLLEHPAECAAQLRIVRDILGRRGEVPTSGLAGWRAWKGGQVTRLARVIYEDGSFEEMPVLGDALEDAGCTEAVYLDHCRVPAFHVRGCWLLDLLLERG
jgi:hypothetical protein